MKFLQADQPVTTRRQYETHYVEVVKTSLMTLSLVAFSALSAFPGQCFAQATNNTAQHATPPAHAGSIADPGMNLLPPPPPGGGGGAPPIPGGGSGGSSSAAPTISYFDRNTHTHTARVRLKSGAEVKVDTSDDKVYVTYAGQTHTFSLDSVLLHAAHGNAAVAAQKKAKLANSLSAPIGNSRIQWLGTNAPAARGAPESRSFIPPNSTNVRILPNLKAGPPGGSLPHFQCYLIFFVCDYTGVDNFGSGGGGGYGFWYYDTPHPQYPQHTQNWHYWNVWRQSHCDTAQEEWAIADTEAAALGAGLGVPAVGWLESAVAGVSLVVTGVFATRNQRVCDSSYPGPNNWGE